MAEQTMVDFVEDWQTGAFMLLVSAIGGFGVAAVVGNLLGRSTVVALLSILGGFVVTFLAISYVLYGRA